jgi:hypothetical protein
VSQRIENHAMISDGHTAVLISSEGDRLALPPALRLGACFAALLGTQENGHWTITPEEPVTEVQRRCRRDALVLETGRATAEDRVCLIDFMPHRLGNPTLIPIVGVKGHVPMGIGLRSRLDRGRSVP